MADIIKIVIKGSRGHFSSGVAYNDKVTITPESISYEYIPAFESELNPNRKWDYKTNSPIFKMKYETIARLVAEVVDRENYVFYTDIGEVEFSITYADKKIYKSTFLLPRDRFVPLFKEIKSMVPKCEYTPAVLMTSEDYEKEE